ncbi:MAG TPA: hypothetical protein PKM12_09580, partial [Marmoricola sp.]|nr:hypothetical protein [Marmoricola sp.]
MKPLDPRILPYLRPARAALAMVLVSSTVSGVATIAQAFALGQLVVEVLQDPSGGNWQQQTWWLLIATVIK